MGRVTTMVGADHDPSGFPCLVGSNNKRAGPTGGAGAVIEFKLSADNATRRCFTKCAGIFGAHGTTRGEARGEGIGCQGREPARR